MKQVIVIRTDLGMSSGKLAVQACHASVTAAFGARKEDVSRWLDEGQTKIVLQAPSLAAANASSRPAKPCQNSANQLAC